MGEAAAEGAGDSVCAGRRDDAAMRQRKTIAGRKLTSATVLATSESTSGNVLMPLQKAVNFLGEFRSDPFRGGDLFDRCFSQSVHRAEFPEQQIFPVLAHARAIVEDTF